MSLDFGMYPIALLIIALFIPLAYCIKWKKNELKDIILLVACGAIIIILYPITFYLSNAFGVIGYSLGKFVLFVLLPIATIFYIEKWKIKDILFNVGVRKKNLWKSIMYGLIAAIATIAITLVISASTKIDVFYHGIMFFEAFTEEFFFRGVLFLYLIGKTNLKVAYLTSIVGFILVHPQHFTSIFITTTIAQAVLLTIVVDKTKNIIGPWISHGLNRVVPSLIGTLFTL
ncbi:MAG: CPBP family intramembrane glutamic endopeptidase [Thermoplasmata archaeon]